MNSECYGCENFEIINGQEVCVKKYSNISCPKLKPALCAKMIRDVLDHEGIKLNTELTDEFGVLDYLLSCDEEYTIYDYIDETKEWYPEYFKKPLKLT